jgi:asparagine synthase (glutamine-hydrolysing)
LRDHIGKKPLFVGRSENEMFITSELKALRNIDWFESLPLGASTVDLDTGKISLLAKHNLPRPQENLSQVLERAIQKRMPQPDQPVGVFLSGGLDSSLIASFVSRYRGDATYFTLGNTQSPDHQAVMTVVESLGLHDVRIVPLPSTESISELIKAVVFATESFNPSIVSNGLSTYLLAKAAKKAGIKVILTGEGADELFGGYHYFEERDPWQGVRKQLIEDMEFTELRRLDLASMAQSVETRCPFLDIEVRGFSESLGFDEMYAGRENKVELRRCFKGVLPPSVLERRKTSFDVGSGIRGQVVQYLRRNGKSEREELLTVWQQLFPHDTAAAYFHSYPVFDPLIDRRGEVHR